MKPPDPNESGGIPKDTTARMITPVAKPKADVLGAGVNLAQVGRWIDEAILMNRNAGSDPCEHQRLGIWLARIRRALP
jgi:hypothetical protein